MVMKTLEKFIIIVSLSVLFTGCGGDWAEEEGKGMASSCPDVCEPNPMPPMPEKEKCSECDEDTPEAITESNEPDMPHYYEDTFQMWGYVSPININVGDDHYTDSEDFYTREMAKLQASAWEQYPGYRLAFDGSIGLRDFKQDLQAFLTPQEDMGIASETTVNYDGSFSFDIPSTVAEKDAQYTIRVSKRVGLTLTKGNDAIYWCYNFYAEKDLQIERGNPVVMRDFNTTLTAYKCSSDQDDPVHMDHFNLPPRQYDYDAYDDVEDEDEDEDQPKKKK